MERKWRIEIMSLNVTIAGTVSKNNIQTDCIYDVFYLRQGFSVLGIQTEFQQYNFNAGSANHLTQNGELRVNDIILVRFRESNSSNPLGWYKSGQGFSSIAVVYNGSSLYTIPVELREFSFPPCLFSQNSLVLGVPYTLNINNSTNSHWVFNGNTMYQREFLHNFNIFPGLRFDNIQYKIQEITEHNEYSSNNVFNIGLHDILSLSLDKVTFQYKGFHPSYSVGETSSLECEQKYDLMFQPPSANIAPLSSPLLGESVGVKFDILNLYGTQNIKEVRIKQNGNIIKIFSGIQQLMFQENILIESLNPLVVSLEIDWFNILSVPLENSSYNTLLVSRQIEITNQPPENNYTKNKLELNAVNNLPEGWNDEWTIPDFIKEKEDFTQNPQKTQIYSFLPWAQDPDGFVSHQKWEVYLTLPYSGDEALAYSSSWEEWKEDDSVGSVSNTGPLKYFEFFQTGRYKVNFIVKDNLGAESSYFEYVDIFCTAQNTGDCGGDGEYGYGNLDISKSVKPLLFNINTINQGFETKSINFDISVRKESIEFSVSEHKLSFDVESTELFKKV